METKNEVLSPEQSMQLIAETLSSFRKNYKEKSTQFLLWGWALTLACIATFIILKVLIGTEKEHLLGLLILLNWSVFGIGAFILQFLLRKRGTKDRVISHLDRFFNMLWMVAGINFSVFIVLGFTLSIPFPPLMLAAAGLPTMLSGLVLKFKSLTIGGLLFFVFAILASFVDNEYLALIAGAGMVTGYLIPGYILKYAKD